MNKPDDVSAEAWEIAKDIEFDFECDWTADGRRVGEIERNSAIASIARAIDAAILRERERCASLANKQGLWHIDASDMALPVEPSPIIAKDRAKVAFSIRDAIRNPSKP